MLIPVAIGTFGGQRVKALCSMETVNDRLIYKIRRVSGIKDRKVKREINDGLKSILFFGLDTVRSEVRSRMTAVASRPSIIKRLGYFFRR